MKSVLTISQTEAQQLIEAGIKAAQKINCPSSIAVVDAFGYLLAHLRMDDAQLPSIEHAILKAKTSALFKKPTKDLKKEAEPGGDLYGLNNTLNNEVIVFAGGIPLKKDGVVVGAIGVSGGTAEQDQSVAKNIVKDFELL